MKKKTYYTIKLLVIVLVSLGIICLAIGVGSVSISGAPVREINIYMDANKKEAYEERSLFFRSLLIDKIYSLGAEPHQRLCFFSSRYSA